MKNRLACLVLWLILPVAGFSRLQAQSVLLDIASGSGNPGGSVTVSLIVESSGGTLPAALQVELAYNASVLTYVRTARGSAADAAGKNAYSNLVSAGKLRVLVAGLNQSLIEDGIVALVEFQIAGNAATSSTAIALSAAVASTLSGSAIPATAGSGIVVIGGGIANPSMMYFPQIADGAGYSTSFILVNPADIAVSGILETFKVDGTPLTIKLNGNLDTAFQVSLPAHGMLALESPGTRDIRAAWARLRTSAPAGGSIIYAYASPPGNVISEAGIDPAVPAGSFALSVDTRRGMLSGLALANPNAAAVSLELTLYSRTGAQLDRQIRSLAAMNQTAQMLSQLFPGVNTANFTGVITVVATGGQVIGTTLRFNSDSSVFSSVPVVLPSAGADAAELYFPQIADGSGFSTAFALINPGNAAITGTLELYRADGSALPMNLSGTTASSFPVSIPGKGLILLESSNIGAIQAGWARVRASGPIGGSIIYAYTSAAGAALSEAGINPASQRSAFTLPVDTRRGYLSGLAVANPGSSPVTLTLTLYSSSGTQVARQTRVLAGMRYFAEMADQLFPGANVSNFTGIIVVSATGGRIVGTTLRFYPDWTVFSSIPVN